jgi:hypothetical protein
MVAQLRRVPDPRDAGRNGGKGGTVTASFDEVRAVQILTGVAMVAWLMAGLAPGLRPYARTIRAVVLAAYLAGGGLFVLWLSLRG